MEQVLCPLGTWYLLILKAIYVGRRYPLSRSCRVFFDVGLASDDLEAAVGGVRIGSANGEARGVFVAHGVEGAEGMFGAVRFNFQVVGDGFAIRPIAEDHFVVGVFELKVLQHGKW